MELSSSNIKKFQGTEISKKFPYIQEMELLSSNIKKKFRKWKPRKKLLIFQETETLKKLLIFQEMKENFFYFRKLKPRKNSYIFSKENFLYIFGNGNPESETLKSFLYFRR